jgi:hypothetical protein
LTTHTGLRIWQEYNRTTSERVTVSVRPDNLRIHAPARPAIHLPVRNQELRSASRPHWLGKREERDERRVGYDIGYAFRDAWEVWCETGLDVVLIAAVSHEDDARAILRQLSVSSMGDRLTNKWVPFRGQGQVAQAIELVDSFVLDIKILLDRRECLAVSTTKTGRSPVVVLVPTL